ncbi:MAG: acetylornithine deacetylase, partial [Bacteroidota bacterium]
MLETKVDTKKVRLKDVKNILTQLISFPVLGGESNDTIATWIENYLTDHGVTFYNVFNEDGTKRSIHCRIGPVVDGGIILSGHTDVVPVAGQDWCTDPFKMVEKDGKLYGRGTCDMKGFLACCLAALPHMLAADLQKPIYFAFSYDEEIGCWAGPALAKAIKHTYTETPRFAIIGEPSEMEVITGQKGMGSMETTIYSRGAHSSKIYTEVSAVHEGAKLVLWLENKMEALIKNGQQDLRFDPPHSTLHVGICNGGIAHNVVADKCTIRWDMRTLPSDQSAVILQEFKDYCRKRTVICQQKVPEFSIETVEKFPLVVPLDTSNDSLVVQFVQQLTDVKSIGAVSFASEAGQFAAKGFETVICGPGSIEQAHRANEFIEVVQLEKGIMFLQKLI